jgi:hypothetical protein
MPTARPPIGVRPFFYTTGNSILTRGFTTVVDTIPTSDCVLIDPRIDYVPTPGEIAAACAAIRDSWTLNERRRRYVGDELPDEPFPRWQPPTVDTSVFRLASFRRTSDLAS